MLVNIDAIRKGFLPVCNNMQPIANMSVLSLKDDSSLNNSGAR
jgi:hypothetical protein